MNSTVKNIIIRQIDTKNQQELAWVNQQYSYINFMHSQENEYIIVAEINGEKAGLGRIVPCGTDDLTNKTAGELGGIHVLSKFQGMGIAHKIVEHLSSNKDYDILYCIPFRNLEYFYKQYGFSNACVEKCIHKKAINKYKYCMNSYNSTSLFLYKNCRQA
ncbi:MAG: hypothetical protein RLZZ210_662 [Pseudomonadota bacterium]|jgi:N-acetylglutamate synthase-like GNAT family acetyltransferase